MSLRTSFPKVPSKGDLGHPQEVEDGPRGVHTAARQEERSDPESHLGTGPAPPVRPVDHRTRQMCPPMSPDNTPVARVLPQWKQLPPPLHGHGSSDEQKPMTT